MRDLRIFVPTWNRAGTISTHRVFPSATVVVHSKDQLAMYEVSGVPRERIVVSGQPRSDENESGLILQRSWVATNLVPRGEWFCFADDDLVGLTCVRYPYYRMATIDADQMKQSQGESIYYQPCDAQHFLDIADETIRYAERVGARLCGFAPVKNYYFRRKKFRPVGYVVGCLILMKNEGLRFNPHCAREDLWMTGDHLLRFGAVAVNYWLYPEQGPHYSPGGLGTHPQRVEMNRRAVVILKDSFPGLWRDRQAQGFGPGEDLSLALRTSAQVSKWRRSLGRAK